MIATLVAAPKKVKAFNRVAVPLEFVTETFTNPVTGETGVGVTEIDVSFTTVKMAASVPNLTLVTPVKLVPVIVKDGLVPDKSESGPDTTDNEVIDGVGTPPGKALALGTPAKTVVINVNANNRDNAFLFNLLRPKTFRFLILLFAIVDMTSTPV